MRKYYVTDLDSNSELEEHKIDRQLRKGQGGTGGARIYQDERVTRVNDWIVASVGGGLVLAMCWVAASITGLKETVATLVTQNQAVAYRLEQGDRRDDRQDTSIGQLQRDVSTLEGRNLRGGPEVRRDR